MVPVHEVTNYGFQFVTTVCMSCVAEVGDDREAVPPYIYLLVVGVPVLGFHTQFQAIYVLAVACY